ncbi:uncharacterized mitochondrial protein AtMg00810-like [Lactuca sativa]|uniref:uncharacterized mitochondrial protein AtMg00810-like n=1 Tax=Lactuca sativa TaxID=4236 RepID=UPI000CD925E0|nr:uncharacterized mitochondrial protein AtMg00810-like [Lactuca sativa]
MEFCMFNSFNSKIEPKTVKIALDHSDWVQAMQEELNEFEHKKVWRLIPTPKDASVVGLKWVFRNMLDKEGNVIQNKEKVYLEQPLGFVNEKYPSHCYILDKVVYGLKQAPRVRQSSEGIFINQEAYTKTLLADFGMVGNSKVKVPMMFRTMLTPSLDKPAADIALYRQMIGSLMYLTSSRPNIMFDVCYFARFQANPREPHMTAVKNILRYLKITTSLGIWYPSNFGFFVQAYSDADLGGCGLDRKSTTGGCQFLDGKLVSWQSKKQTCVSLSTTKVEYITVASCTSQVVWIQSQLKDYGINMKTVGSKNMLYTLLF